MENNVNQRSLHISDDLWYRLRKFAKSNRMTTSQLIRVLLENCLAIITNKDHLTRIKEEKEGVL